MANLSSWAQNSLALYRGNNPQTILRALNIQNKSVVKELMDHFGVTTKEDLAFRLSIGF